MHNNKQKKKTDVAPILWFLLRERPFVLNKANHAVAFTRGKIFLPKRIEYLNFLYRLLWCKHAKNTKKKHRKTRKTVNPIAVKVNVERSFTCLAYIGCLFF
jgi:hypothetical protein